MRQLLLLLLPTMLTISPARAQGPKRHSAATRAGSPADKVSPYVEEMPQPPGGGGHAAIVALIQRNIRLPPFNVDSIVGSRVMVAFTVTAAGAVRDVRIRQSIDGRIDSAVVQAVRALPRFTPGRQRGQPVSVRFTVPVTFHWQ